VADVIRPETPGPARVAENVQQIPRRRRLAGASFLAVALAAGDAVALAGQQQGMMFGTVVDEATGERLERVKVMLVGTELEAVTDTSGIFQFSSAPVGMFTARAELAGYATVVEQVEVPPDEILYFRFVMSPVAVALEDMIVRVTARTAQGTAVVEPRLGDRSQTALDLLREGVPGLRLRPGANGGRLRIRSSSSLSSNDPAVFLDGVLLGSGFGASAVEALERIPAEDVLRIRVLHGPSASAVYGDSNSGVILVETR
jgi:hypothetical protein